MNCYAKLGMKSMINAGGHKTKLGGSIMPNEVLEAMREAAEVFVDLKELQIKVGEQIAKLTNNEASYVTSGASAGLFMAAAACIAGAEVTKIGKLPDTKDMKNEIIIHRSHRNPYELAVLPVGAKIVDIGYTNQTEPWQLSSNINNKTAAVFYFYYRGGVSIRSSALPLEKVVEIAHEHDVPVVLDAAAQLPPMESLWRYTQMGVDLVVFSGGKELQGPQDTGIIVGKKKLIEACQLIGSPNYSIARSMKVSKESLIGILAAVERYISLDHNKIDSEREAMVSTIVSELKDVNGISVRRIIPDEGGRPIPVCELILTTTEKTRARRDELVKALQRWETPIAVNAQDDNGIIISPQALKGGEEKIIVKSILSLVDQLNLRF